MRNKINRRSILKSAITGLTAGYLLSGSATASAAASGEDWPQFQYDAANTGYNPNATGPTGELTERWSFSTLGEVVSSPIVVDDTVYVGSKDGKVYALNAETGDKEWEYDTGADIHSSPVSDGTTIYIGNQDGTVFAISLDGVEEWTTSFDGAVSAGLSVADQRLFVPEDNNQLIALSAANGSEMWRLGYAGHDTPGIKPAVHDSTVYFTSYSKNIAAYSASDGEKIWRGSDSLISPPTYKSSTVFISTHNTTAINSSDGLERWVSNTEEVTTSAAVWDRSLFTAGAEYMFSVDTVTGNRNWRIELPNSINSAPVLAGDLIYIGCDDGNVYSFKQSDGSEVSSFETGAAVQSTAAVSGGAVFIGSDDGYVYAIEDLPANEDPTASFSYSPSPVIADQEAEFDASESEDPDDSIESYTWDFDGNGATDARGETVTTTFDGSGERDVTLTVTDDRGATAAALETVTVNQPPEPSFSYSTDLPNINEPITFDASESTDPDGAIDQFEWDFDDDGDTEATGQQVSHTFSSGGDHLVRLTVTDSDGTTELVSQTVTVNEGPVAAFSVSPEEAPVGQTVTFDADESNDPEGSIERYEWDFEGNDSPDATGETATRTYENTGEYTVALTVTDANGLTDAAERTVTVVESPETPTPEPTTEPPTGGETITGGGSEPRPGGETTATPPGTSGQAGSGDDFEFNPIPVIGGLAGGATLLAGGALLARNRSSDGDDTDDTPDRPRPAGGGSTATLPDPDGELDASFGDFEKQELIGSGGNADVHRAVIAVNGVDRVVALKTPRVHNHQTIDVTFAKQFLEEAETWNGLDDHNHIVDVLGWGHSPQPWIAMEYMDGGSLREHLPLTIEQGTRVLTAVADATQHAHRHGVAHGDLKPENILFGSEDGEAVVKVGDWGLATVLLDHSESTQGLSPAYAAPEQFDESPRDAKGHQLTDVYQLGALAYAAFTGQQPYDGSPAVIMNKVLNETPTKPTDINPNIPPAVDDLVLRAMAKDPDDRYPTARHFRDALSETLNSM